MRRTPKILLLPVLLPALLGLLVALVVGPAGPVGAAAAAAPTTVTLTGPTTARVTTTVPVGARLADGDGGALAGRTLTLQRYADGAWTTIVTGTTGADGTLAADVPVTTAVNLFRAVYAGDATTAGSVSPGLRVAGTRFPTRLAVSGDRTVVDEHTTYLKATWTTTDPGTTRPVPGTVSVYSRPRGGSWHRLTRVALGADGTASIAVRPRVDTWFQLRGTGSTWWSSDISGSIFVDNLPPGVPVVLPRAAPRAQALPQQRRGVGAGVNVVATRIPTTVWRTMDGITWHRGCPVGRSGLRLVRLNYWGYDGYRHRGELVVNAHAVGQFRRAFTSLYAGRFPIRAMYRPDRFGYNRTSGGGDDYASMRHDNTSAFNCRWVSGNPGVRSPHSYGYALDLNTWENPYRSRWGYLPDSWWMGHSNARYAWRSGAHGVVRAMRAAGFAWTYGLGDTQHFDAHRSGSRVAADTSWRARGYVND